MITEHIIFDKNTTLYTLFIYTLCFLFLLPCKLNSVTLFPPPSIAARQINSAAHLSRFLLVSAGFNARSRNFFLASRCRGSLCHYRLLNLSSLNSLSLLAELTDHHISLPHGSLNQISHLLSLSLASLNSPSPRSEHKSNEDR